MKWMATIGVLALVGCTKSVSEMSYTELRDYVGTLQQKCLDQGVPPAEMDLCVKQEASADQARLQRRREIGAAIAQASAEYNRSVQANRPVNCTSTGFGNTVQTTCY